MENTLENKAKFFAQYWGQKFLLSINRNIKFKIDSITIDFAIDKYIPTCLELKPISSITDEDAIDVAEVLGLRNDEQLKVLSGKKRKETVIDIFIHLSPKGLDSLKYLYGYQYLQSKGFFYFG